MKILFDFSTASQDEYLFNYSFFETLIKPVEDFNTEIFVIVSKDFYEKIKLQNIYKKINFLPLDYNSYLEYGYNIEDVFRFLYSGSDKEKYLDNLTDIYKQVTNDLNPDVIINFEFGNCVTKKMYPNALHLVYLGGVWKSLPPDFSICLDPINSVSYSSLINFSDNIKNFKITETQNKKVEQLKTIFKNKIINTRIAQKELRQLKLKYKKLLLLPLQLQGYMFEGECKFKSQKEYFEYVMERVPKNIGVIVTGHFADISFIKEYISNNKEKYPNAVIIEELFKHPPQTSLYVLPYIDGMVNVCSSLVLKALLCDVKIFSLGHNYNKWCLDYDNIEDIEIKLNEPPQNKNNILYWYLTHYDVNTKRVKSKGWLYSYLNKMYNKRNNIDFSYFEQIISADDVIEYFKKVSFTKKFKEKSKIFSIDKTDTHKIYTILGMRIKLRRKLK